MQQADVLGDELEVEGLVESARRTRRKNTPGNAVGDGDVAL